MLALDPAGTVLDTLQYLDWGDPSGVVKAGTPDGGSMTTWYVPFIPSSATALLRAKPGPASQLERRETRRPCCSASACTSSKRCGWRGTISTLQRRLAAAPESSVERVLFATE